jgi:uncharacterized membrane protein YsdA (DUF1294 family)/cold shock CspA family protein
MRFKGTIIEWNEARGFGFIEPALGGERVFCHISAFRDRSERPAVNKVVTYAPGRDERGRPRAQQIRYSTAPKPRYAPSNTVATKPRMALAVTGSFVFLGIVFALVPGGRLPWLVIPWYALLSVLTLLAYGWDKSSAKGGHRRISESSLNTLALMGGWPGAWIAQQGFRHKSRKASFQSAFWTAVVLNVLMIAGLAYAGPDGWDVVNPNAHEKAYKEP